MDKTLKYENLAQKSIFLYFFISLLDKQCKLWEIISIVCGNVTFLFHVEYAGFG